MVVSRQMIRRIRVRAALCGLAATLSVGAGCHTLPMPGADPLSTSSKANAAQVAQTPAAQQGEAIQVEFRSEGSKPERRMITLKDEMHVQEAMQQSNAFRRYSRAKIELVRKTPAGNSHKMDVSYERGTHKIDPQTDYQIRPGDVLIITEDPSGVFGDMIKGVGLPLNSPSVRHLISG